jgi:GNAT superfamily N-acetyltransferase
MTTGYAIRPIRADDIPAARALMITTFEEDFGTGYIPQFHSDVEDIGGVYINHPRHALFVAVDDDTGELIATAGVRDGALKPGVSPQHLVQRYSTGQTAQLVRVYTHRRHRRRGAARALVQKVIDHVAADEVYTILALHTYPHSPGAMVFWESIGVQVVADDRDGPSRAVFFEIPLALRRPTRTPVPSR